MSYINRYGYKPYPVFKTMTDMFDNSEDVDELMFGVELEIDKGEEPEDTAADLLDTSSDIYCKHDGSLGDNGIEIVTHPCSLDYHCKKLGWENIVQVARDHDYTSQQARTCGLHIHVGRWQMGDTEVERAETAAKTVILVSRFWDQMVTFSRRREAQLSDWAALPMDGFGLIKENLITSALETESNGRYQAVNLTNENTVEFRLFNGTLNPDTIKASLQLVNNIVSYAKDHDTDDVICSQWRDVAQYEEFPELDCYLAERGLCLEPRIPPITFLYETSEEFRIAKERERKEKEERKRREREARLASMGMREEPIDFTEAKVGDQVVVADPDPYSDLSYFDGVIATITQIFSSYWCDFELRFPDQNWRLHESYDGTDRSMRYMNVVANTVHRLVPLTASEIQATA